MPRRKRHYVYCKAVLHLLPRQHVSPRTQNATGMKKHPHRVGDRGRVYVARECSICKDTYVKSTRFRKSLKRKTKRVLT